MVAAAEEGRRVYANIRRFLLYGLSGGTAEILVMLIGPFLGLALPLLPAQILWVNLLTHGLPGVALGAEPAEPGTDAAPASAHPRSRYSAMGFSAPSCGWAALTITVLAAGTIAYQLGWPWQSIVFVVLGLAQLGIALAVRAPRRGIRANPKSGGGHRAIRAAAGRGCALPAAPRPAGHAAIDRR